MKEESQARHEKAELGQINEGNRKLLIKINTEM